MSNSYYPIAPIGGVPTQTPGEISASSAYALGTKLEAKDGRLWRYAYAGGVALNPGYMGQAEAIAAEALNEVQDGYTTSIGDTTITVLITTASGITNGDLAGGWMTVVDGTGEGHSYSISNNVYTTGDTVMTLTLNDPIIVATEATSEITLSKNLFNGVIVAPTTLTGICVGVPNITVTANNYYWAQRRGPVGMVVDTGETVVVGEAVGYPAAIAVAGACGVAAVTDHIWGQVISVADATETAMVNLCLE